MKILIIDDDEPLALTIKAVLERENYAIDIAVNEDNGIKLLVSAHYDVVLLLMVRKLLGLSVCRRIREQGASTAIMILTATSEKESKIECLDAGADDYLVEPFDYDELSARIRALMRRPPSLTNASELHHGSLRFNTRLCSVMHGNTEIKLTPTEYRMLLFLARNPSRFFKADALIDNVWSTDRLPSTDAVKTHMKTLRRKLREAGIKEELIESGYGFGYRLKTED